MMTILRNFKSLWKMPSLFLWILIAVITFLLPNVIIIYRYIEANFGGAFAGKIPFLLVIVSGTGYILCLYLLKNSFKNLLYLIPCAFIVWIIFTYQENPNKHIHIPEYVLLTWLVYAALSRDYRGSGGLLLVFVCTSMLGLVDELEQGIHPGRFYGLSDMLVNTSSALIGVFTILGLKGTRSRDWSWTAGLRKYRGLVGFILFGVISSGFAIFYLFQVQAQQGIFRGVYPEWLLYGNLFFLFNSPLMVYLYRKTIQRQNSTALPVAGQYRDTEDTTARMWIYPIITILFYMHLLIIFVSITGVVFL